MTIKKQLKKRVSPVVLVILDGWGVAPKSSGNAISLAHTPTMDYFYEHYPSTTLKASGRAVGLPLKQSGNSEAGHMNIGAGRVVKQDTEEILEEIKNGKFFQNAALLEVIHHLEKHPSSRVHVVGLLTGFQSSHSYPDHLYALLEFLKLNKVSPTYLHLFSDGRDSGKYEGVRLMEKLTRNFHNGEIICSLSGRFYAMDRAQNWDRTKATYDLLTGTKSKYVTDNPIKAFTEAYNRGESDEYLSPTWVNNPKKKSQPIKDGDVVIFFNCRSERARQLIKPFVQKDFEKYGGFKRVVKLKNLYVVTFTNFAESLDHTHTAFPHVVLENTLPCALATHGVSQVYVAEREKYAHMTYFFNGGVGESRCGEDRIRIPSVKVASYIQAPAMSTPAITKRVLQLLNGGRYEFIALNFANADMLGHTGDFKAAISGVEVIDRSLQKIYRTVMRKGGTLIITADHGNAEQMYDFKGLAEMHHSSNPVPFFLVRKDFKGKKAGLLGKGSLSQISPTILEIMGFKKPVEMTAKSLLKKKIL